MNVYEYASNAIITTLKFINVKLLPKESFQLSCDIVLIHLKHIFCVIFCVFTLFVSIVPNLH